MNKNRTPGSLTEKLLGMKKSSLSISGRTENHKPANSNSKYTEFENFDLYRQLELGKSLSHKFNLQLPYFRCYEGMGSSTITFNNEKYINFSSYNYLNFNGHPDTLKAVNDAVNRLGTTVSASRPVSGERYIHKELESEIADFYGTEDSVVLVSGHATNVAVISTLFGIKDLILYDISSHNSIIQGIKLSDAKAYSFKHNDYRHLETLLTKYRNRYQRVLIVIEGLYSMDGDVPDLPKFIDLKKKFSSFLMVDEAHSLGILGSSGKGLFEHFNTSSENIDIWMGTLSKTLCSCGGYIAGKSELIEMLKYHAAGFVYSVGISPMNAAAALSSLKLLKQNSERVQALQNIGQYFLSELKKYNINTGNSLGLGIIPIIIGGTKKTVTLSNILFEKYKINVNPIVYPAVEEKQARLRLFINSTHTKEQIDYTVKSLRDHV